MRFSVYKTRFKLLTSVRLAGFVDSTRQLCYILYIFLRFSGTTSYSQLRERERAAQITDSSCLKCGSEPTGKIRCVLIATTVPGILVYDRNDAQEPHYIRIETLLSCKRLANCRRRRKPLSCPVPPVPRHFSTKWRYLFDLNSDVT